MRSNRKEIPRVVKDGNLNKGDIKAAVNNDGIRVINYKDKKNVYMISTLYGPNMRDTGKKKRSRKCHFTTPSNFGLQQSKGWH